VPSGYLWGKNILNPQSIIKREKARLANLSAVLLAFLFTKDKELKAKELHKVVHCKVFGSICF